MENQAVLVEEHSAVLYVALELSRKNWKVGFSDGKMPKIREVTIEAGDLEKLRSEIEKAKKKFELCGSVGVRSCYEAGREGFWVHRALTGVGIENIVVDAASIEVNRRQRRAKTDRMDVQKLVRQLIRYWRGEQEVWRVARVPSAEDEARRQLHRELETLKEEKKQHQVRIHSLLFRQGIDVKVRRYFLKKLEGLRMWNGQPIAADLGHRIQNEYDRLQLVEAQIREIQKQQSEQVRTADKQAVVEKVRKLQQLRGIGMGSSWVFVME